MNYAKDDREAHWNNYGQTPRNIQQMERLGLNATHVGRWDQFDSRVGYAFEQVDLFDDSELMTALSKTSGDVSQTNHTFDGQLSGNLGSHLLTSGASTASPNSSITSTSRGAMSASTRARSICRMSLALAIWP